jgi:hypothetical protein
VATVTSKIASHELDAFLEVGEALLKVFYVFGHVIGSMTLYCTNGAAAK